MPNALTAMSVSGWITESDNQSPWLPSPDLPRALRDGGSLPPSAIDSTTEVNAMPSPMQWWMRTIIAEPPS